MEEFELVYYLYDSMYTRHRVKHVIDFSFSDGELFWKTYDDYGRLKISDISYMMIRKINKH